MDNYKAAKRILEHTIEKDWQSALRACAHALIAVVDRMEPDIMSEDELDMSDLQEKNRLLLDELDRMRSKLTQSKLEADRLEKWIEEGTRGGSG